MFNRGLTGPDLFPELEQIRGDRETDLGRTGSRRFDAVLDTSGYLPPVVQASVEAFRERVELYVFISSISVYADLNKPGQTEEGRIIELDDPTSTDVASDYGALKAACEAVVNRAFVDAALVIRPGLIVGPYDPTNRFTYWVTRLERGGRVLAPAPPERPVQIIDARDLADWMVAAIERGLKGTFNAVGPEIPFQAVIESCQRGTSGAEIVWVDPVILHEHGVEPWTELPLWIPQGSDFDCMMRVDGSLAVAAGLSFRSLTDTVNSTRSWAKGMDVLPGSAGLDPQREFELIEAAIGTSA